MTYYLYTDIDYELSIGHNVTVTPFRFGISDTTDSNVNITISYISTASKSAVATLQKNGMQYVNCNQTSATIRIKTDTKMSKESAGKMYIMAKNTNSRWTPKTEHDIKYRVSNTLTGSASDTLNITYAQYHPLIGTMYSTSNAFNTDITFKIKKTSIAYITTYKGLNYQGDAIYGKTPGTTTMTVTANDELNKSRTVIINVSKADQPKPSVSSEKVGNTVTAVVVTNTYYGDIEWSRVLHSDLDKERVSTGLTDPTKSTKIVTMSYAPYVTNDIVGANGPEKYNQAITEMSKYLWFCRFTGNEYYNPSPLEEVHISYYF